MFRAEMRGGTYGSVSVAITPGEQLALVTRDTAGNVVDSWFEVFPSGTVFGLPVSVVVQAVDDPGGVADSWAAALIGADGTVLASISELSGGNDHGRISAVLPNGTFALAADTVIGHVGVWIDPAFTLGTDDVSNARAIGGWAGEMAHERIARLLREQRIASDITATVSTLMGPQEPGRVMDLLLEASDADHGLLDDSRGAVAYRALSEMYGQTPALTIDADAYELGFPLRPITDDQKLVNKSTVTRRGGSSGTVDRTNGAAPRLGDDPELNLYDDSQPIHHAGWYVNLGTVKGKRVPKITVNFLAAPQLAAAFLALRLGDRVQVVNAPQELAHSGVLDLIWVGWNTATRTRTAFTATANCAPYAPYDIAIYGTDANQRGRYGAGYSTLASAVDETATTLRVRPDRDVWATSGILPGLFPGGGGAGIDIDVGGLTYNATDILGPAFVAAGTAAHADNAAVSPGLPAGAQAGDLLVIWAAIRSSGVGTVGTPAGYTTLLASGNTRLCVRAHSGSEVAPTVTPSGGSAGDTVSAQMAAFRRIDTGRGTLGFLNFASQLNSSGQDIPLPEMLVSNLGAQVWLYLGWKQDDWTSVAPPSGATEIDEPDSTTGSDQGLTWAYRILQRPVRAKPASFVVTGGGAAISRGILVSFAGLYEMTVTRLPEDKAQAADEQVTVTDTGRAGL
ncbi:hypothetical protein ACFQZ4_24205 [Catellatospora coxensis]